MPALRVFLALGSASFLFAAASSTPRSPGCAAYEHVQKWNGTAVDDGNSCTSAKVVNGVTTYDSAARDGLACSRGSNPGKCQSGECVPNCATDPSMCICSSAADCPAATECSSWTCDAGTCNRVPQKNGMAIDAQTPGDCQVVVCNDKGEPESRTDDTDKPGDSPCITNSCVGGAPAAPSLNAVGTSCASGMVCDGNGACVNCLSAADWMNCGANCAVKLCQGEACTDMSGQQCETGKCVDGSCCESDCTGECMSCGVAGAEGTCTNVPFYKPDLSYIDGMKLEKCDSSNLSTCNGMGKCLSYVGGICSNDTDCVSSVCQKDMVGDPFGTCLGATGEPCKNSSDCASGICMNLKCSQ